MVPDFGEHRERFERVKAASARRPRIWRASVDPGPRGLARNRRARLVGDCGRRRSSIRQTVEELLGNPRPLLVGRVEDEGVIPLEARLERPANAPIGVAEMVVDLGIVRRRLNRLLQRLDRALIITEPVIGPAEAVDDMAGIGLLLDRRAGSSPSASSVFSPRSIQE